MRIKIWCLLICLLASLEASVGKISMEKLGFHNNYNEIVRDLIKNWESPIVYLRQLGYLPSDYEDTSRIKPNLDALMSRIEHDDQQQQSQQAEESKYKDQFHSIVDYKKLKKKRREASETQSVNYPTVDQLLAMSQHARQMPIAVPQAKPTEQNPMRLSQMLASQRQEQVRPQLDTSEETLQRLVDKTSPYKGSMPAMLQVAIEPSNSNNDNNNNNNNNNNVLLQQQQLPQAPLGNVGSLGSSSSSMYGTLLKSSAKPAIPTLQFSRPDAAQSKGNDNAPIEGPQYLNWNIAKKQLDQISPKDKSAYVDKLVQIYVKKQEALDMQQKNEDN